MKAKLCLDLGPFRRIQYHLIRYLICLGNYDILRRAPTIRSGLNPRPRTESQKGIEKRRVTSRYHGSKVSGSPQSFLTETVGPFIRGEKETRLT